MVIQIIVKPSARKESVEKLTDGSLKVSVVAPPHEGRANEAVIKALASHFKIAKSRITILSGFKGKKKLVEIG